jgi:hypothetical protein
MFATLTVVGMLLVASAAAMALADSDNLSTRMPTQVPPRRLARYPFGAGVALLTLGVLGAVLT